MHILMVSELRDTYQRGRMSRDYRISQLRQMELMLEENQEMIPEALWRDLHKVTLVFIAK